VISSGPKGFLDIPRTLEYLETQGVHVSTFADGREGAVEFPAFWARDSGIKSPLVVYDEAEAAAIIRKSGNADLLGTALSRAEVLWRSLLVSKSSLVGGVHEILLIHCQMHIYPFLLHLVYSLQILSQHGTQYHEKR